MRIGIPTDSSHKIWLPEIRHPIYQSTPSGSCMRKMFFLACLIQWKTDNQISVFLEREKQTEPSTDETYRSFFLRHRYYLWVLYLGEIEVYPV